MVALSVFERRRAHGPMDSPKQLPTGPAPRLCTAGRCRPQADCVTLANSWTMRSQKAGRSSGDRLVVMLPSVTTCSSTTSAPALRRSVRMLGKDVSRRPRATSASTRVHGPWQIDGDRLARVDEVPHEADRGRLHPQLVRVDRAAGQQQRVELVRRGVADQPVDAEGAGVLEVVVARRDLAVVDRQQVGPRAGVVQGLPGLLELDPLHAVGREDRDPPSVQLPAISRSRHRRACRTTLVQPSSRASKCS